MVREDWIWNIALLRTIPRMYNARRIPVPIALLIDIFFGVLFARLISWATAHLAEQQVCHQVAPAHHAPHPQSASQSARYSFFPLSPIHNILHSFVRSPTPLQPPGPRLLRTPRRSPILLCQIRRPRPTQRTRPSTIPAQRPQILLCHQSLQHVRHHPRSICYPF